MPFFPRKKCVGNRTKIEKTEEKRKRQGKARERERERENRKRERERADEKKGKC